MTRRRLLVVFLLVLLHRAPSPAVAGADPGSGPPPGRPVCRVTARMVDAEGRPVEGARLGAQSMTAGGHGPDSGRVADADADGRVELELPPDVYRWAVTSPEHPTTAQRTLDLTTGDRAGGDGADGCAGSDLGAVVLPPGRAVEGRVVSPQGEPVADASVWIQFDPHTPSYLEVLRGIRYLPHRETETGADGRFLLPGLTPETGYTVWVRHDLFALETVETDAGEGPLRVELDPAARLVVRAEDEEGRPVEGAEVRIEPLGGAEAAGGIREVKTTGAEGEWLEGGLEPGELEVVVEAPGHREVRRVVELAPGEGREERFVLEAVPSAPVTWRVVEADGRPVAGAQVFLSSTDGPPATTHRSGRTDETGTIRWPRTPLGSYRATVRVPAGVSAERPEPRELEVVPGGVEREVVLSRPPGRPVEGRVVGPEGDGLPGVTLRTFAGTAFEIRSGEGGRFRFEHLPYGEHSVHLEVPGLAGTGERRARVGEEPEPWIFRLPRGVRITGRVLPGPGVEPEGSWQISARRDGPGGVGAAGWMSGDLTYRFPPLAPGRWVVEAKKSRAEGRVTVDLAPADGEVRRDVPVEAPDGYSVFGELRHRGRPLEGARVGLMARGTPFGSFGDTTDGRGRFRIEDVPAGTYSLSIGWGGAPVLHRTITVDGPVDLSRDLGFAWLRGRVEVEGVDPSTLTVNLHPLGPEDPSLGWFHVTHSYPEWARPTADGWFEAGPLEEGRWRLSLDLPGHAPLERELTISGGADVEDLVLAPEPTEGLRLRVQTADGGVPGHVALSYRPAPGAPVGIVGARGVLHQYFELEEPVVHWSSVPHGGGSVTVDSGYTKVGPVPVEVPGPTVDVTLPARGKLEVRAPLLELEPDGEAVVEVRSLDGSGETFHRPLVGHRDPPGTFFTLPPGFYEVHLAASGGTAWTEVAEVRDHQTAVVVLD